MTPIPLVSMEQKRPARASEAVEIALLLAFSGGYLDAYTWVIQVYWLTRRRPISCSWRSTGRQETKPYISYRRWWPLFSGSGRCAGSPYVSGTSQYDHYAHQHCTPCHRSAYPRPPSASCECVWNRICRCDAGFDVHNRRRHALYFHHDHRQSSSGGRRSHWRFFRPAGYASSIMHFCRHLHCIRSWRGGRCSHGKEPSFPGTRPANYRHAGGLASLTTLSFRIATRKFNGQAEAETRLTPQPCAARLRKELEAIVKGAIKVMGGTEVLIIRCAKATKMPVASG
jgi:hypothetical protein